MKPTIKNAAGRMALIISALAVLFVPLSCQEGPVGIFASVAGETPVNANMTKAFEKASPSWVAKLGTDYYAGVGVLWKRPEGGAWSKANVSSVNAGNTFAISGAVAGSNLYVVFVDTASGNKLGVWTSTDGASWSRTDPAFPAAGEQLINVLSANGQLFATTRTSTEVDGVISETHSLYYLNGAAFSPTAVAAADIGTPVSAAHDGTDYWFAAGTSVLRGDTAVGVAAATDMPGQPSAEALAGITNLDGSDLLVTTRSGRLYQVSGGTWTASAVFSDSKDKAFALSKPAYVDLGATDSVVLAGTQAYSRSATDKASAGGYLEFKAAQPFVPGTAVPAVNPRLITDAINFDTSLAFQSVSAMYVFDEGSGHRAFALADGHGLWSNYYDGAAWSKWARE